MVASNAMNVLEENELLAVIAMKNIHRRQYKDGIKSDGIAATGGLAV